MSSRAWCMSLVVALILAVGVGATAQTPVQLVNPASQNCLAQGGALRIESRPDGGQYGVCVFVDN